MILQQTSEVLAGELAALIAIEYLGLVILLQSLFPCLKAEGCLHAVGQPP